MPLEWRVGMVVPSSQAAVPTRMDLARWLTSPEHPLTARVAVNRFWQQLFGVGLVRTSEDFGQQGETPSHPELLDHLAIAFVESGWDVKALLKSIVMSATYQQSSVAPAELYERDPDNRWLARGSRFRLDSEVLRDQILAASGLLNRRMYGKSVKPPQPAGLWKAVNLPGSYPRVHVADRGDAIYRRSVYTFWKRGLPPPQMTILDAPNRESCVARRERTNTPLQALLLLNEAEFLKAARELALDALTTMHESGSESEPTPMSSESARSGERTGETLELIYETITSRVPDAPERATLMSALSELEAMYRSKAELATRLCADAKLPSGIDAAQLAAWTVLTSSIFNLDITKNRD